MCKESKKGLLLNGLSLASDSWDKSLLVFDGDVQKTLNHFISAVRKSLEDPTLAKDYADVVRTASWNYTQLSCYHFPLTFFMLVVSDTLKKEKMFNSNLPNLFNFVENTDVRSWHLSTQDSLYYQLSMDTEVVTLHEPFRSMICSCPLPTYSDEVSEVLQNTFFEDGFNIHSAYIKTMGLLLQDLEVFVSNHFKESPVGLTSLVGKKKSHLSLV